MNALKITYIATFFAAALFAGAATGAEKKPLNFFILAVQSNMEGPASIRTIDPLETIRITPFSTWEHKMSRMGATLAYH